MKGRTLALQLLRTHLNSSTRRLSTKMERRMCAKTEQRASLTVDQQMDLADQYVEEQLMRAKQIKESAQPAIIGRNLAFLGMGILLGVAYCWDEEVFANDKPVAEALQHYRELRAIAEEREKEAAKKKIEEQGKQK